MKRPAVSIASVFASGIAIGLWPMVANRISSREFYFGEFGAVWVLIAAAIFLVSRHYLRGATILSLAAWLVLSFFGATIAQEPKPQNYILKEVKLPVIIARRTTQSIAWLLSLFFRFAEMIVLTLVLQVGMLPLLARDFRRVPLSGPLANLFAVPLTGILVPLGFATLLFAPLVQQAAILSPCRSVGLPQFFFMASTGSLSFRTGAIAFPGRRFGWCLDSFFQRQFSQ